MKQTHLFFLLGLALVLSGCLIIPVNHYARGSRHNIDENTDKKIQVGVTTKDDVFSLLGEPDLSSEGPTRFGYAWTKVVLVWAVSAGAGSGIGGEIEEKRILRLLFDEGNLVSKVDILEQWEPERVVERRISEPAKGKVPR